MSQYWVNFARTGDPNGPGLPKWPSVKQLPADQAMILNDPSGPGPWLTKDQIAFYQAQYDRDVGFK